VVQDAGPDDAPTDDDDLGVLLHAIPSNMQVTGPRPSVYERDPDGTACGREPLVEGG
jgi:hypothetical protein